LGAQWQEITSASQYAIVAVAVVLAGSIGAFLVCGTKEKRLHQPLKHSG
jgi:hypothetical protein